MKTRFILGLDLSMNSTGYAVVKFTESEDDTYIEVIEKGLIKGNSTESHSKRLRRQYRRLNKLKERYEGERLIVTKEGLHYGRPKTSAILGKIHGVVDLIFPRIHEFGASTIKKEITGKGNAGKEEVEASIKSMIESGQQIRFKSDDESDAVAIAITYYLRKLVN